MVGSKCEASIDDERWRKIKFLCFLGEDAFRWLKRVELYFQMKGVTQYKRLQVIKVAMEENEFP